MIFFVIQYLTSEHCRLYWCFASLLTLSARSSSSAILENNKNLIKSPWSDRSCSDTDKWTWFKILVESLDLNFPRLFSISSFRPLLTLGLPIVRLDRQGHTHRQIGLHQFRHYFPFLDYPVSYLLFSPHMSQERGRLPRRKTAQYFQRPWEQPQLTFEAPQREQRGSQSYQERPQQPYRHPPKKIFSEIFLRDILTKLG